MPVFLPRLVAVVLVALALPVAGCGPGLCPKSTELEAASAYTGYEPQKMTLGAWVEHKRLAAFIGDVVRAEGIAGLETNHGFRCTPRPEGHTCTRAIPKRGSYMPNIFYTHCVDEGDMQVRAEIGPGSAVRAMSFWDQPNRR
jgi:hypothetical protein